MQKTRLLLVDDEQIFLANTAQSFARRNVDVETASTGAQALELLNSTAFDVAVLDISMPGMGGLKLLETLRGIAPQTEVILLSGYASTETALRGLALGASEYMLKPVPFDELYFKVVEAARTAETLGASGEDNEHS